MNDLGQFGDGDTAAEVLADVGECAVDLQVGLKHLFFALKTLYGAHEADDTAFLVKERELVRHKPVWYALVGEEQFYDVELWLAGGKNLLVIPTEIFGKAGREEVKVIPANHLSFMVKTESLDETTGSAHEPEFAIFGKESEIRQMIEHLVKRRSRTDTADEPIAQRGRGIRL